MGEVYIRSCVGLGVGLPDRGAVEEMVCDAVARSVCRGGPGQPCCWPGVPLCRAALKHNARWWKAWERVEVGDLEESLASFCVRHHEQQRHPSGWVQRWDTAPHQQGMPCKGLVQNCSGSSAGLLVAISSLPFLIPRSMFSCWHIICYCFFNLIKPKVSFKTNEPKVV